jgi:hypothetical protein
MGSESVPVFAVPRGPPNDEANRPATAATRIVATTAPIQRRRRPTGTATDRLTIFGVVPVGVRATETVFAVDGSLRT